MKENRKKREAGLGKIMKAGTASRPKGPKTTASSKKNDAVENEVNFSPAEAFAAIISGATPLGPKIHRLLNCVFFLGAGFSRAWDDSYPLGKQLFEFNNQELPELVQDYCTAFGLDIFADMDMGSFKDLLYSIHMQSQYPTLLQRYSDTLAMEAMKLEISSFVRERFYSMAKLHPTFDPATKKFALNEPKTEARQAVIDFFGILLSIGDGSMGVAEGLRPHILTTNYDALPEAILDDCLGPYDSVFNYFYRGITPREILGYGEPRIHNHTLAFNLLKLNGGFEISRQGPDWVFDYPPPKPTTKALKGKLPPELILPNREQDYSSLYFESIFGKAVRLLQEADILVIVGYSIPEEDALLRLLLRQFAESETDLIRKRIFYVDLCSVEDQRKKLASVLPYLNTTGNEFLGRGIFLTQQSFPEWCREVLVTHELLEAHRRKEFQAGEEMRREEQRKAAQAMISNTKAQRTRTTTSKPKKPKKS